MSTLRADNISNRQGGGAPTFPNGAVVSGVLTATTFDGNLNGTVTLATNAEGLTEPKYRKLCRMLVMLGWWTLTVKEN